MRFKLYTFIFFINIGLFAQNQNFKKIKQEHSKKIFHKEIFKNPALMYHLGKYKFSTAKLIYERKTDEVYRIQQPNSFVNFGFEATSFFPIDSTQTLWGGASYSNRNDKNIRWNENVDFDIIYPYITADAVGGNMKKEIYTFLGGYNKNYKNIDLGISLDYKANLSSRNRDPRPKNISSNLSLKLGVNLKYLPVDFGLHLKLQKYTQANSLVFYNEVYQPTLYHLNGLGYFNNLFKGDKKSSFYDAYGYGVGAQIGSKKQDLYLTFDIERLVLEKLNLDLNNVKIAELTNQNMSVSLSKLFKNNFGVKLNYQRKSKNGIEPFFSSRNGLGLNILSEHKNYKFTDEVFSLKGLFYTENKYKILKIKPYINYEKYREDYFLIRSFRHFDYISFGLNFDYLYKINSKNTLSFFIDINYRKNLKNNYLLRNDDEVELSKMLKHNAYFLSKDVLNTTIDLEYFYELNPKLNLVLGLESGVLIFKNQLNSIYNFSAGITF